MSRSQGKLPVYTARGRRARTALDYVLYVGAAVVAVGGVVALLSIF